MDALAFGPLDAQLSTRRKISHVNLPLAWLDFVAALPLAVGVQLTMSHAQVLTSKDMVPTISTLASVEVVPDIAIIAWR